jgi:hypothetical protein
MVMTDKEQTKLVAALQNPEHDRFPMRTARDAAVEIERLVKELRISNKALSMCSDECNRLYEKYDKKADEIQQLKRDLTDSQQREARLEALLRVV